MKVISLLRGFFCLFGFLVTINWTILYKSTKSRLLNHWFCLNLCRGRVASCSCPKGPYFHLKRREKNLLWCARKLAKNFSVFNHWTLVLFSMDSHMIQIRTALLKSLEQINQYWLRVLSPVSVLMGRQKRDTFHCHVLKNIMCLTGSG